MKRGVAVLFAAILTAASLLSGCSAQSTKQGSDPQIQKESKQPVTIRFWRRGNDAVLHNYFEAAIKQFEKKNPGYKVEYSEASYDDYDLKLNAAYASGDVPDLVIHAISSIGERTAKGQFAPLDEYYKKWPDKEDMINSLVDLGSYKGSLYGIAFNPTANLMAYRKDFAAEAGLDPEKPPTNWADFAAWAEKLTKREKGLITRSGYAMPVDDNYLPLMWSVMLGDNQVLDATSPTFDTPELRKSLEYLADLYRNKKVSAETTFGNEKKTTLFASDRAAIELMSPTQLAQMTAANPSLKDKIGFMYLKEKRGAYWSGCQFFFVSSDSKKKNETWKLLEYLMSKEEVWNRYKNAQVPVVLKSLQEKANEDDKWLSPAVMYSIENGVGSPKVEWANLYLTKYTPALFGQVLLGGKSPDQAIKDNWAAIKKEINAMGGTGK